MFHRIALPGCLLLAAALLSSSGCSSSNACEKACKRVTACFGETGAAPTCNFSAECSAQEQCQAKCISGASCAALTGQDPQAAIGVAACQAACGSVTQSDVGPNPDDGGPGDIGVVIPEGSLPFDGLQLGDTTPPVDQYITFPDQYVPPKDQGGPTGSAVAKFCNGINLGGSPFTAVLKLGGGGYPLVSFSAYSGECDPVQYTACPTIPSGSNIPFEITDGSQSLMSGTLQKVDPGLDYALVLQVDQTTSQPQFVYGAFKPGYTCKDTDPFAQP